MRVLSFLRDTAIDLCLGCRHEKVTRPFTIEEESYMVCLDCGRRLFYSVETMRRLSGREVKKLREARSLRLPPQPGPAPTPAPAPVQDTNIAA